MLFFSLLLFKSLIGGRPRLEQGKIEAASLTAPERKTVSTGASESLAQLIDGAINNSRLASARWGISVISLDDGRRVYGRNAEGLFTPASNMKIYTTAVALDLLGADYRWRTSVYATTQPDANGTIAGDLVLYGRGAPDLVALPGKENSGSLVQLANDLYSRGVRRVTGNVIGDESYFRGQPLGDGWPWTDVQWYFGAEASALSINKNEIDINILPPNKSGAPPQVRIQPADKYVSVQNNMLTVRGGERMTIGIHRGLSDNAVRVWGEFPADGKGYGARLAVHNPALWAASLFHESLRDRGIAVDGVAAARDSRQPPSKRFDPSTFTELAFISSEPLSEIVRATNKASLNLYAELLLRTLGRERGVMLSTPEPPGRERGDDEAGLALIRLWLSRARISTEGLAFHDGSGLSRLNLVTPESISRLLVSLSKSASGTSFRQSLPVSGRDGTLGGRLSEITDRVAAKTGSLTYHSSLSGYVTSGSGQIWAFSIICNDHTTAASANRVIDQIVTILATHSPPTS